MQLYMNRFAVLTIEQFLSPEQDLLTFATVFDWRVMQNSASLSVEVQT